MGVLPRGGGHISRYYKMFLDSQTRNLIDSSIYIRCKVHTRILFYKKQLIINSRLKFFPSSLKNVLQLYSISNCLEFILSTNNVISMF